jgi:hypothetical protein
VENGRVVITMRDDYSPNFFATRLVKAMSGTDDKPEVPKWLTMLQGLTGSKFGISEIPGN